MSEPRTGHSASDAASPGQSRRGEKPPSTCWPHSSSCAPEYHWLPWSQGHIAGSWFTCCPPGPPGPSLQSFFPADQPLMGTGAWGYSSPGGGPCTCLCWNSWGYSLPNSLACPGIVEWQHSFLVCRPSPPSFVSSASLLRAHSVPSPRSLMTRLNKTAPSTDPWGTSLATGL